MRRVPLAEATQPELLRFAKEHLRIPQVQPASGVEKLKSMIHAANWREDYIEVQDSAFEGPQQTGQSHFVENKADAKKIDSAAFGVDPIRFAVLDPRVLIEVNEGVGKDGGEPVFTAVNGQAFLIPRRARVEVPYRYFLALSSSEEDKYEWDGKDTTVKRTVKSYPHTVHRMPTQEEISTWQARMERIDEEQRAAAARRDAEAAAKRAA